MSTSCPFGGGAASVTGLLKNVAKQSATLGVAGGLAATGGAALDSSSLGEAAGKVGEATLHNAEVGAVFGAAGKVFPDATTAQWLARFASTSGALDAMGGNTPWDDRPLSAKAFDYGLNAFFALHGAGRTTGGWFRPDVKEAVAKATAAQRAEALQQTVTELGDSAASSELRRRDQAGFRELVGEMLPDANLYVSAKDLENALHQSGVTGEQLAEKLPDVVAQLAEAVPTNGDVKISVADYAAFIAGGPADAALRPHFKSAPDGMSFKESQDWVASQETVMRDQAAKIIADEQAAVARGERRASLENRIADSLNAIGRFPKDINAINAKLPRAFFEAMAERYGTTPEEMFNRFNQLPVRMQDLREGLFQTPREEDVAKSEKRYFEKYPGFFPLSMPKEIRDEILKFNVVSRSPYSDSFYDITNKSWDNDPDEFLRVSDHWNFESGGRIHAKTDVDVKRGHWTIARHTAKGVYEVIKSLPKHGYDSQEFKENIDLLDENRILRDAEIKKTLNDAIGRDIPETPAAPLKGRGYDRRELTNKTKEDKRRANLIKLLFPKHFDEIYVTRNKKALCVSPEVFDIPLDSLNRAAEAIKNINSDKGNAYYQFAGQKAQGADFYQFAWHGGPHRGIEGEGFRLNKIGTGEGNQVYGYGIYFADKREVAEGYRHNLGGLQNTVYKWQGKEFGAQEGSPEFEALRRVAKYGLEKAKKQIGVPVEEPGRRLTPEEQQTFDYWKKVHETINLIRHDNEIKEVSGQLYSAEIPDAHELLDWDKPLSEQPEGVRRALQPILDTGEPSGSTGERIYKNMQKPFMAERLGYSLGDNPARAASEYLNELGIPGLRYLDGNSRPNAERIAMLEQTLKTLRSRGDSQAAIDNAQRELDAENAKATHNYVIWDESRLNNDVKAYYQARSAATRIDYERRIDELFAGAKGARQGVRILDRADILDLLGHGDKPLHLVESAVGKLIDATGDVKHHGMTAEQWKKVPEWIENPVAAFKSQGDPNRLVLFAPELVGGRPVRIILEPNGKMGGMDVHVAVNAYEEGGTHTTPVDKWVKNGDLLYLDQKESPAFSERSGLRLPRGVRQLRGYGDKVQTDADLVKYRSMQQRESSAFPRGAYDPKTHTISLFNDANLSSWAHENGHFFTEATMQLAAELEGARNAGETLTTGQQSIIDMAGKLLKHLGVRDLTEWHGLDLETRRPLHEQMAESFERYMLEGKAPSVELQPLFQSMRGFMLAVYKSIKNFLRQNPQAGKLNDEVRRVFDMWLASDEAIADMEHVRGYQRLFESAEAAGMTPEDFAEYQRAGIEATEKAKEELAARSLRAMQLTSNALQRARRSVERDVAGKRAEIEPEVRRHVMRQPIYQAWQFLTGKIGEEDKIAPPPRPDAGNPNAVEPERDSLFKAIAKLGGLNREAAQELWGLDPADKISMPVFGKPVLRKEGGLSPDAMAEALSQHGYLPLDANGKWDIRDLEAAFREELSGNTQYSNAYDYGADQPLRAGEQIANPQALGAGRLDIGELKTMPGLPDEVIDALQARKMTAKTGLHPDIVSDLILDERGQPAFTSGDELARALAEARDPEAVITAMTDQLILERHGDIASPEAMERAAEEAIHNDARARFIAAEMKALAKASTPVRDIERAAKLAADAAIAAKRVGELNSRQYLAAEARANRETAKALAKDDIQAAAVEKRAAILNNRLFKAATEAEAEVKRIVANQKRYDKDSIRKKVDPDILEQIDALRERFDFRQVPTTGPTKAEQSLKSWMDTQKAWGYTPVEHPGMLDPAVKKPYRDMTMEEIRGFHDTIRSLETIGRQRKEVTVDGQRRDLKAVVSELIDKMHEAKNKFTLEELLEPSRPGVDSFWRVSLDRMAATLRSAEAEFKPQQFKANQFDRHEVLGPFTKAIFDRVFQANYRKIDMMKELSQTFRAGAKELGRDWQDSLKQYVSNRILVDEQLSEEAGRPVYRKLTRGDMLGIARHVGNESNFDKLTRGMGWRGEDVWRFLFENMTEKDWRATQSRRGQKCQTSSQTPRSRRAPSRPPRRTPTP